MKSRRNNLFPLTFFISLIGLYAFAQNNPFSFNSTCTSVNVYLKAIILLTVTFLFLLNGIKSKTLQFAAGFVIAGGFFIVFEAQLKGCVLDYLSFLGLFRFNLADLLIFIGAVLVVFDLLVKKKVMIMYNHIVNSLKGN